MSNFLAVATVTATMERVLQGIVGGDVPGATVTTVRPNGPNSGVPGTGVNVFLYHVMPNPGLRNLDLPNRRPDGTFAQQPVAALDLHYLLSFYGAEAELEPQRLLGSVVRTLHAQPLLVRETIRNTVNSVGFLAASDLADQVETVRFTPLPLNLEELSKLWSVFFQTTYVLSVAYQASVVLITADEEPLLAQPVQERTVAVFPSLDLGTVQAVQPDALDGLQLWLRADTAVSHDTQGRVTRWADQSGLGHDAFQVDTDRMPVFVRNGLNDKPILRFDGIDDHLALEGPMYDTAGQLDGVTLIALVRSSSSADQILVGFDRDEYWRVALRGGTGGLHWQTFAGGAADDLGTTTSATDGRWHVIGWRFAAGESPDKEIFLNGDTAAVADAHGGTPLGSGTARFGFVGVGSAADVVDGTLGDTQFLNGDIVEILLYHRGLTELERRQIERYLVEKYTMS